MKRVIFSSDELPATLDDSARFRLWRDLYVAHHGEVDMTPQTNQPFTAKAEFVGIGAIMLMRFDAAIRGTARTLRQVAADGRDHFLIRFNRGGALSYAQHGREVVDNGGGGGVLYSSAEPGEGRAGGRITILGLSVPRARLLDLVAGAEDLVGTPLDSTNPAARHLRRYLDFLLDSDDLAIDVGHREESRRCSSTLLH